MKVGKREKRGRREVGVMWCVPHHRPSPNSITYCRIEHAMFPHCPENQCRIRGGKW